MRAYIALGSNLGDRVDNIRRAIDALSNEIGALVKVSSLYETEPVDMISTHYFINAAAIFETTYSPVQLLEITQEIERQIGRNKKSVQGKYTDRLIDIDLLQVGDFRIDHPDLIIPHPRMIEREFVLRPLAEIDPQGVYVGDHCTTFSDLLQRWEKRVGNEPKQNQSQQDGVRIEELFTPTPEIYKAIVQLVSQLTSEKSVDWEHFCKVIHSQESHLFVLSNLLDNSMKVIGMLTMVSALSPSGWKIWIEDVVVDKDHRGRGYAKLLIRHAKSAAAQWGADDLMLTSRPTRVAANALYVSEKFLKKDTNVYYLPL